MKRTLRTVACLLVLGSLSPRLVAQDETAASQPTQTSKPKDEQQKPEMMSLIPELPRYDGSLWERSTLTGDWGGTRTELANKGIIFDFGLTQSFQLNAYGGKDTNSGFRYSGSVDYSIKFDTARMGLWPAGLLYLKGETQFGKSMISKTGAVMAPNADALFPVPDDPGITTLTDVVYTQFLSEHFGFQLGKVDFRGGDNNAFANSETTQFMNLAFLANPVLLRYAPYSALMGTIIVRPADWLMVSFTAMDSFGSATVSGFDTAFHSPEGTTFINEWDFTVAPFKLEGHQRFGFAYSTRDYTVLNQDLRLGGPIRTLVSLRRFVRDRKVRADDWAFYYNFDQYLYQEPDDPTQGIGLFGRFGWSTGEANPIAQFYSIGVGGKGLFPKRDNDTYGLGYYFLKLSDDLPLPGIGDEQGVELYYNIEVTPWLHITPDLQVLIDPGGNSDRDPSIVCGIRMQVSF